MNWTLAKKLNIGNQKNVKFFSIVFNKYIVPFGTLENENYDLFSYQPPAKLAEENGIWVHEYNPGQWAPCEVVQEKLKMLGSHKEYILNTTPIKVEKNREIYINIGKYYAYKII